VHICSTSVRGIRVSSHQHSKSVATEVAKAVSEQSTKLNTIAFAKTGPINDRAAQKQIRGSSARYLSVNFDAKSGQMRDQDNQRIPATRQVTISNG
jgi:hypothetical protein